MMINRMCIHMHCCISMVLTFCIANALHCYSPTIQGQFSAITKNFGRQCWVQARMLQKCNKTNTMEPFQKYHNVHRLHKKKFSVTGFYFARITNCRDENQDLDFYLIHYGNNALKMLGIRHRAPNSSPECHTPDITNSSYLKMLFHNLL